MVFREARTVDAVPDYLPLPEWTVHRLFDAHGLMRRQVEQPTDNDRRRFAYQKAGELWTSGLRYGLSAPKERPVQVWHDGSRIQDAKVVNAFANCFIRRNWPASTVVTDAPAQPPKPSLSLRQLD